ncbi:MAG: B12-binding domain-containing radical SAM protein [Pseudomonadota bacterium]
MTRPRILLVNPWIHDFAAYDLWARPMGLLVLATRLRRMGWEVSFLDCLDRDHPSVSAPAPKVHGHGRFPRQPIPRPRALDTVPRAYSRYGVPPEYIKADLTSLPKPKVVFVTSLMTYWYPAVAETIRVVRESLPSVPIVLGGVYAGLIPEHAQRNTGADMVVSGAAEGRLADILSAVLGDAEVGIEDDATPEFSPALDLMRAVRFLPLITSRGCPFRCHYCASRRLSPHFVRRCPQDAVREVEEAYRRYNVLDIALYDDAFLVDAPNHALPILNAVAERVPGTRWHSPNGLHAAAIDADTADAMKKAGFETIRLGLESTSDLFHARTGGKVTREAFLGAVRRLRDAGFERGRIGAYLLVGIPGQTRSQIEDDVELALNAGAYPKLAEFSPIPGTAMWPAAVKRSPYPIEQEPLFHNCTLLPAAEPEVDWGFLRKTRERIREAFG